MEIRGGRNVKAVGASGPTPPTPAASGPTPGGAADAHVRTAAVRPLPGGLDDVEVLNSNHPEILTGPGIGVSTLAGPGPAGLDHRFRGPFEIFTHHQNRAKRPLHQAIVLHNPGSEPATVTLGPSAAFTTHDAPYRDRGGDVALDPRGELVSGPGDAVATALLHGRRAIAAPAVTLAPGETRVLHTKRIPPGAELTSQYRLDASGPVQAAVVIEDAEPTPDAILARLRAGRLLPRNTWDPVPSAPGARSGALIYGRVAGVQAGAAWHGTIADPGGALSVGAGGLDRTYLLNGKDRHTAGAEQVQSAPLLKRYPDSAYAAHGNYGVTYDLAIPLRNAGDAPATIALGLETPGHPVPLPPEPGWKALVRAIPFVGGLLPAREVSRAIRGSVEVEIQGPGERRETRLLHLSQRIGERASRPLAEVVVPPGEAVTVRLRMPYPANATAPHLLRVTEAQG